MRQARRLGSVLRALCAGRASDGLSTEGLEAHPVTLRACACQDQKPQVESGLEALVAAPAVVAGTCCPLVAVWLVSTAGGRSWEGFVSSPELPGAEQGVAKRHRVGTEHHV